MYIAQILARVLVAAARGGQGAGANGEDFVAGLSDDGPSDDGEEAEEGMSHMSWVSSFSGEHTQALPETAVRHLQLPHQGVADA